MIPSIAAAPALIMVGIFMMEPLSTLDLSDFPWLCRPSLPSQPCPLRTISPMVYFFHAQLHSLHGSDRQKKAALSHDADPNGSLFDVLDSGRYFLTEWRVVLC